MDTNIRLIKKYPNRRLYDTNLSCYITLEEIKDLVLKHVKFKIVDTRTNVDVTNYILLQIISEQENNGSPFFTTEVLQNIIRFYGNSMQAMMSKYLEKSMALFTDQQVNLQENLTNWLNHSNPFINWSKSSSPAKNPKKRSKRP